LPRRRVRNRDLIVCLLKAVVSGSKTGRMRIRSKFMEEVMKSRIGILFGLVLALAGIARGQSPVFVGTCNISQISYTATDSVSSTFVPKTFTDIPNTLLFVPVNVGECLKIEFSISIASESEGPLILRVLFDENPDVIIVPGEIRLKPTSEHKHFTVSFILPLEDGLGPGNHNVRIQWRSPEPSRVVSSKTSVVVHHN